MGSRARAGDVVSRRKGIVMHRGVALGDGRVLHNTPFKGEHICTEAEFSAGRRLYVESADLGVGVRVNRAVYTDHSRSYNILTNNCEHTVNRVTRGKAESPQLRAWVLGAGLAVATFALTRHPAATAAAYAIGRKLAR